MNVSGTRAPWNATGGIPLNVTLHGWLVPPAEPETKPAPEQDSARLNHTSRLFNLNATGYVALDEDITDPGFTDVQTLILAGVGTLLTLISVVGVILGARVLWHRYQGGKEEGYEGVLQREESSEPGKRLLPELKTSESQFTAGTEDQSSPTVLTPKSNGSVITMTLKNNHLIVETEETTCTSPSVIVDSRGSMTTYITNSTDDFSNAIGNSHGALIHRPPDQLEDDEKRHSQTGLSQSDLSMSSSGSQNISYRYGNQTGYDTGGYGYSENSNEPYIIPSQSSSREFNKYTRSPSQMDRADSVVSATDVNMFLRSDISARNAALERKRVAEEEEEEVITTDSKNAQENGQNPNNEQQKTNMQPATRS